MTGTDMETLAIIFLTILGVACCVMFWVSVLRPARSCARYEYLIADFNRDISRWEHEQND